MSKTNTKPPALCADLKAAENWFLTVGGSVSWIADGEYPGCVCCVASLPDGRSDSLHSILPDDMGDPQWRRWFEASTKNLLCPLTLPSLPH